MNILDQISSDISQLRIDYKKDFEELSIAVKKILDEEKYYSIQEFSDKIGIHYQTTRNAIKDGRIKAKRFGERRLMIHSDELEKAFHEVKSSKYKR